MLGPLRVVPPRGPVMGLSLAGPSGVGLGLRALRWFACVDLVSAPVYILSLSRFKGEGPTRENGEPARKETETRNKAEAGKKCMPGRRVEERVKSNEATKGTRGSQRPSKGRAQGRGHGRHTASTTPHRDTGEGGTRGTGEGRHNAPRHAQHRHHTHRTHPTSPSSPPSGRAVGGGTACNRCIVVDLCCNCEACSLDAPGVVMPDTAPDISEPA